MKGHWSKVRCKVRRQESVVKSHDHRSLVRGQGHWSEVKGHWSVVSGQRSLVRVTGQSQRTLVNGHWSKVTGQVRGQGSWVKSQLSRVMIRSLICTFVVRI